MRRFWGILLVVMIAGLGAAPVAAQPAPPPASMEPPPPPYYQPPPAPYGQAPAPYAAPAPRPPRRGWFGTIGLGGMGYVARPDVDNDTGDKGSGVVVDALVGKWLGPDAAVGARVEAHTDDAEFYTDSSFTVIARFPVGAGGRFYVEPGFGLAFHKNEISTETENGLAVAMTAGYALTRHRFAFDLRFGVSHSRFDRPADVQSLDHGTMWVGAALGFQ